MAKSPILNVMLKAANKAGRALVRDFGEVEQLQVSRKGPSDFVSKADRKAEEILVTDLTYARPTYGVLAEEGTAVKGDGDFRWIIDPLDGTTNFVHGMPHWCISIGLEQKGEIVAGLVYDPLRDEAFMAEKGGGAFMNNHRLRVSGRRDFDDALIATGLPAKGTGGHARALEQMRLVMAETSGVRRAGAGALDLAYVAAGRYDGFWEYGLRPWDLAAGLLLVTEAGGMISPIEGSAGPSAVMGAKSVVAGNSALHGKLRKMLQQGAEATARTEKTN
jgi:myo-inositol-1(or 4)-monophosphatase